MYFFDEKDGTEKTVQVPLGQSLLEAAHENEIDLEGVLRLFPQLLSPCSVAAATSIAAAAGACEGSLACSTCHVVVVVRP